MTVDLNSLSINTDKSGFDSLFDYSDMLQELADELDAFRNIYRSQLSSSQRNRLRSDTNKIRQGARDLATITAIELLTTLNSELDELRGITQKIDGLITDIQKAQDVISGVAEVVDLITNILKVAI